MEEYTSYMYASYAYDKTWLATWIHKVSKLSPDGPATPTF